MIVIDRPKGFVKKFKTSSGKQEFKYPIDYGYYDGLINPEDDGGPDVFVGTGQSYYGKFVKLNCNNEEQETKWFIRLTATELSKLLTFLTQRQLILIDWQFLANETEVETDVHLHCTAKT